MDCPEGKHVGRLCACGKVVRSLCSVFSSPFISHVVPIPRCALHSRDAFKK